MGESGTRGEVVSSMVWGLCGVVTSGGCCLCRHAGSADGNRAHRGRWRAVRRSLAHLVWHSCPPVASCMCLRAFWLC